MLEYDPIDISLYTLTWFVFVLVVLVENGYQIFKVLLRMKIKKQRLRNTKITEQEVKPIHIIGVFMISITITISFFPYTIFTFLPFRSVHWILDIFYSSLFLAMGASTTYNIGEKVNSIALSFVGRILRGTSGGPF